MRGLPSPSFISWAGRKHTLQEDVCTQNAYIMSKCNLLLCLFVCIHVCLCVHVCTHLYKFTGYITTFTNTVFHKIILSPPVISVNSMASSSKDCIYIYKACMLFKGLVFVFLFVNDSGYDLQFFNIIKNLDKNRCNSINKDNF